MSKARLYLEKTEEVLCHLDILKERAEKQPYQRFELRAILAQVEDVARQDYFEFLQRVGQGKEVLDTLALIVLLLDKCEKIREELLIR